MMLNAVRRTIVGQLYCHPSNLYQIGSSFRQQNEALGMLKIPLFKVVSSPQKSITATASYYLCVISFEWPV